MRMKRAEVLACLSFVARARGVELSLEALARRFGHLDEDMDAAGLKAVAGDVGLDTRSIHLDSQDLLKVAKLVPAILFLRDGSTVVLEQVQKDPTAGVLATLTAPGAEPGTLDSRVVVDQRQLSSAWGGALVLVKRNLRRGGAVQQFGVPWLIQQVLRERNLFRDIAIASVFATAFALAPPFITMIVVDRVIVNHSTSTLIAIATALAFLIVFEMILGFMRRYFVLIAATRIDGRMNLFVMERLLRLPMDYFERTPTGYTLSQVGQLGKIRSFMTGQLFGTFLDMVTLLGLVPVLVILNWKLSAFVFACAGAIFVIIYVYLKPLNRLFGEVIRAERNKGVYLTETLYGMRAVKSLVLEDRRRSEWDRRVASALEAGFNYGSLANYPQTFVLPFERLMFSGSIMLGAAMVLAHPGAVYPGSLIAFSMLAGRTAAPLVQLARLMNDLGDVRGAIAEVSAVVNQPLEELRADTGLKLPVRGQIAFSGVDFRYAPGAPLALSEVTFNIQPGAIFGIMGRSGSGKTTITRLLQGLNPSYEGLIKVDGMDLREMDLQHLRLNIGVVPQENFLFSGSIRENISVAVPGAPMERIVRAAQLAGAEEFIEKLPRGYETRLEEGASNLSGGQRQRLALARALLIDPPVLILDEATSALDAESEAIINANLARIASDRTIICVSHRLSMLVPASAILVMERGKVYDIGRHEELLSRCDIYKHMWYQQNKHVNPDSQHAPVRIDAAAR